jgi:general L-amino acid transport system permease protein
LAAAIAYPDIVLVFAGTVLMQTGQAVEIIAITMTCYLILSLLISGFMNWYNQKMALVER